jgi:hypothetical protein
MEKLNFDQIRPYITFNKKMKGESGQFVTISINIPEMADEQLIAEVKHVCGSMQKCIEIMSGVQQSVNPALAATTGSFQQLTSHDASRMFEKGFGILVKLNNEIVVRGLSDKVESIVRKTLGREAAVAPNLGDEQLMIE